MAGTFPITVRLYSDEKTRMAHRHHFRTLTATVALAMVAASLARPAHARLPWAATSGLHFVEEVVNADNYRAAAAGLAMKKSPSPDVRDFGRMLWESSIENTSRLRWLLNQSDPGVVLPSQVTPQYMFVIDELVPVAGDAFDRRFIAQQTASLTQALALAQAYAQFGDDFDLKEFARRSVPKIQMQLDAILEIEMRHERSAPG